MIAAKLWQRVALVLALAWAALIFYLSSRSTLPIPLLFPMQDKLMHFTAYGVMGFLVSAARQHAARGNPAAFIMTSVVLCGLYGLSDEYHQSFVPGRDPDVFDLCADVVGALAGTLLVYMLLRNRFVLRAD